MTHWILTAKSTARVDDRYHEIGRLDASGIDPQKIRQPSDLAGVVMRTDSSPIAVGELFDIESIEATEDIVTIHPGPHLLDRIGAAADRQRAGIRGGTIHICGNAGDLLGHRMRRGQIIVDGNVAAHCGAAMIAGTILVAGTVGPAPMDAARRGTFITSRKPSLPPRCFTRGVSVDAVFASILARGLPGGPSRNLIEKIIQNGAVTSRGDQSVGGKAEILWPNQSS